MTEFKKTLQNLQNEALRLFDQAFNMGFSALEDEDIELTREDLLAFEEMENHLSHCQRKAWLLAHRLHQNLQ